MAIKLVIQQLHSTLTPATLNNASDYQANGLLSDPTIGLTGYWTIGLPNGLSG